MTITLFGATGYTGQLVAQALIAVGWGDRLRLAGRSAEKLAQLSARLAGSPPWLVADAQQPGTLPALCQRTRVLINCVGPFTDLGELVVAQAARSGVHYLDTTNELGFVHRMRVYDAPARQTGAAIVPACGFEVTLADCAAAALARGLTPETPADEIRVTYALRGKNSSRGSRRSAVRSLATSWLGYRDGRWSGDIPGRRARRVRLPEGLRPALSFPSSEIATLPAHIPVRCVTTWTVTSENAPRWAPMVVPVFARLARGAVGRLVVALSERLSPPPETGLRSQAPFLIKVALLRKDAQQTLLLTGRGVYERTADIIAYAAQQLADQGYDRSGVLAPAAALDPAALLAHAVAHWGVEIVKSEQ